MYQFIWEAEETESDVDFAGTLKLIKSNENSVKRYGIAAALLLISILGSIGAYKKNEKVKKVVDEKFAKLKEIIKKIGKPFVALFNGIKGGAKAVAKFFVTIYMKTLGKIFSKKKPTDKKEEPKKEAILINSSLLLMTEASEKKINEEAAELNDYYKEHKEEIDKVVNKVLSPAQIEKIKRNTQASTILSFLFLKPLPGALVVLIAAEVVRQTQFKEYDINEYYNIVLTNLLKTGFIMILIVNTLALILLLTQIYGLR